MQCEEKLYSMRRAIYAVRGQCVSLEKKSAVSGTLHLQYK